MTVVFAVDLAARLSAAVQRGAGGEVLHQFDSRNKSALAFCAEVARTAASSDLIVIEDIPYGISSQAMVKPALRLQGAILSYLIALKSDARTVFMSPDVWMKDFPGIRHATTKGLSKAASDQERIDTAAFHAERLGYLPPDLVGEYESQCQIDGKKILKKNTNPLAKSMTDYISAWLMSEYSRQYTLEELLAKPGCSAATL